MILANGSMAQTGDINGDRKQRHRAGKKVRHGLP
jgi:hypothetical protein